MINCLAPCNPLLQDCADGGCYPTDYSFRVRADDRHRRNPRQHIVHTRHWCRARKPGSTSHTASQAAQENRRTLIAGDHSGSPFGLRSR